MPSQDKADEILTHFPGPVSLYPSRTKWLTVLLGCAAFTVGGIGMIYDNDTNGWLVAGFFGLGVLVSIVVMLPGASALKLDRDRFEVTGMFRRSATPWQAATGFEVAEIPPSQKKMVVYDDANARGKAIASLNVGLTGRNSGIPDTYGLSAEELADLLIQWRARSLAATPGANPPPRRSS